MKFPNIAKFIKDNRLRQRLTQDRLSRGIGYKNGQFISNVERGKCSLPIKCIPKLCETLEVSTDEVIKALLDDYKMRLGIGEAIK